MPLELCPWEKPILLAAATGKVEDLQQELKAGKHVDTRDSEFRRTCLHWAVLGKHDGVVQLLLTHGADRNAVEPSQGRTPLLDAVAAANVTIMKRLIDAGADVDMRDMRGDTPLILATRQDDAETCRILLEADADPNSRDWCRGQTALSLASEKGHEDMVCLLLSHDATISLADDKGTTPLIHALQNDHAEIARMLAAKEARDDSGNAESILSTAVSQLELNVDDPYFGLDDEAQLLQASKDQSPAIVREVLERNVHMNVDIRDEEGRTPLSHAAREENIGIATMLLDRGADVNSVDDIQWTPLMVAAEVGLEAVGSLLLQRGANPNTCGEDGVTPLLLAARAGCVGLVAKLLDFGADLDAQDESENLTAISIAAENSDLEMVELFLDRGIMPDMDDRTLLNALQDRDRSETVESEGYRLVQTLVKHGVEVYMDACSADQPLVIATRYGLEDIVALFLQAEFTSAEIRQEHIENAVRVAAEEDEEDILQKLMAHYVRRDTDDKRRSPWDWAKDHPYEHPAELLRPYYRPVISVVDGSDPKSESDIDDSNAV
jgi:ankyrin repeat protein